MRTHALPLLFLASALLMTAVAPVQAQDDVPEGPPAPTLSVTVSPHGEPIVPITGLGVAELTVAVTCETGTVRADAEAMEVGLAVAVSGGGASALLFNETVTFALAPEDCLAGTEESDEIRVAVYAGSEAAAGSPIALTVTASAEESEDATVSWNETTGVYMSVGAQIAPAIQQSTAGDAASFTGTATNDGNSAVNVMFMADEASELGELELPEAFELAAGAQQEFEVVATAPEDGGTYELVVTAHFTAVNGTDQMQMVTMNATLENEAVVEESPALPFAAGIVVLVALVARRRR